MRLLPPSGPQQVVAVSNLVNTTGSGIYLTAGVLYFTQAAHLPASEVGLGLGAAGIISLAAGITVGHIALRDCPYLLVTALDGVMSIQFKVLTVALPLWLIEVTNAPRWLISTTMLLNTAIVIAFQVRASRGVNTPSAGGRAYRRSGVAFLASCSLLSLTAGVPAWVAVTLMLTAVLSHAIGELWHSAAGFEVSFALAPDHATGQYLGVFGLGLGLAETLGPGLLIALCITWGQPGWYVIGTLFTLTGLAAQLAVRWAEHHRPTPATTG